MSQQSKLNLLMVLCTLAFFLALLLLPVGKDWRNTFYPVAQAIIHDDDPYQVKSFYNPPWVALALSALGWMPERAGFAIWFMIGLAGYAWAFQRMGATPIEVMLLMISPPVMNGLQMGNIDWAVLLGATLPVSSGLWLVVVKPHLSMIPTVLQCARVLRSGWMEYLLVVIPVALSLALAWLLGLWNPIIRSQFIWSQDLWPWGVPFGLWLSWLALKRDDMRLALAAGPFLSPYLAFHSWSLALVGLIGRRRLLVFAVFGLWGIIILRICL